MKSYRGYILDLDGTTYVGKQRLTSAEDFVHRLKAKGLAYMFMTNNATRGVEEIYQHLGHYLELPVSPSQIYTSAIAAVEYLKEFHNNKSIFVLGEASLKDAVRKAGLDLDMSENAQLVLQGLDRQVNYETLTTATRALLNGAEFIVTNRDQLIPTETGSSPSSGAITAFLEEASQVKAHLIGKPSPSIVEAAIKKMKLAKEDVLMIGDNYKTDIQAGHLAGVDTLLVLTGVSTEADVDPTRYQPTYICSDLGAIDFDNEAN
ncbi:TIGR01457 family HAD-type hydrolase [Facklamia sp. DSM 111018]|uniref:TIGR01457 family HAD-type hydrolase n=1 Tax=Facklamia lactis TaxID=2749967 RepID=A0ABS0LTK6_9LACT|nr:TIGR01457 family HAD-type hydrolase [Facklamia lactis]MBG9981023.1 TIGR01457 family HAD-type hydrolase [Facklamia lactis]MBG9986614.1 TIGR01457 family HAD-type hydrolase [Facklamia lactis]